jgi:16S rRNA (uracil1498-N3)-methyltransferase
MRLHRFFIAQKLGTSKDVLIEDRDVIHQWKNVFRLESQNEVILLDNSGIEYLCEIETLTREFAKLKVIGHREVVNVPKKEITLFCSLIKKDNFEWILEKGTELGVSEFMPVLSERSEKKDFNFERGNKIIKEASEQSGRGKMPILNEIVDLEKVFSEFSGSFIAFHPEGEKFYTEKVSNLDKIGVLTGPEGGWTDNELELFQKNGVKIYSLGSQVLRAETAAIAVASLFLL